MKNILNNKTIWVIALILFSLILVLDLAMVALVPAQPAFSVPESGLSRDFEGTDLPAGGERHQRGGDFTPSRTPLQQVRSCWLPIAAVCILADIVCAVMLSRIKAAPVEEAAFDDDEDDLHPRGNGKGYLIGGLCMVLAAVMIISSLTPPPSNETVVNSRVISGKPQDGVIQTVLSGAGTLADAEAEDIEIPVGVEVKAYHVHNGDAVKQGDVLATVDQVAAAVGAEELQTVLEALDKAMNTEYPKHPDTIVKAPVAGRVKAIFAEVGKNTSDTMYENGALILLSLDGHMAAQIPTEAQLHVGQDVVVTLDGAELEGRVASFVDSIATVTVSDEKAAIGQTVTAATEDGTAIGEGTLYINSELKLTGFYGTVSYINARLDQKVTAGGQLLTLKDTGRTAAYTALANRRVELEEQMEKLTKLAVDGCILATCDGIVTGIPEDTDFVPVEDADLPARRLSAADGAPFAPSLDWAGTTIKLIPMGLIKHLDDGGAGGAGSAGGDSGTESPGTEPGTGGDGDEEKTIPAGTYTVTFVKRDGINLIVSIDNETAKKMNLSEEDDSTNYSIPFMGIIIDHQVIFGMEFDIPLTKDPDKGDQLSITFDASGKATSVTRLPKETPSTMRIPFGGFNMPSTPIYETYDLTQQTALSIIPPDEMVVAIQVDELDVLSLQTGLEATINLDAMKGKTFTGTVTRIDKIGVNSGGNTKYTVEVTLPREEQMLAGMNASVKMVTSSTDTVSTVPAAALTEVGGRTFLYTAYDGKTDTLSGLVEVETGVSDGTTVELLSGLDAGASYYYRYADQVVYDFSN